MAAHRWLSTGPRSGSAVTWCGGTCWDGMIRNRHLGPPKEWRGSRNWGFPFRLDTYLICITINISFFFLKKKTIRFQNILLRVFPCVFSTPPATCRPWPTRRRRRPALGPVGAAAVSTIPGGAGHGDSARSRRKRRTMMKRRRSIRWPVWKRSRHKVMECRRQQERVVGAFRDEIQSKSDKVLWEEDRWDRCDQWNCFEDGKLNI